jgi:hypothetical protein
MSDVGARKVASGQLALVWGALVVGRMDVDQPEHAILLDQVIHLLAHMSFAPSVVTGGPLEDLRKTILDYKRELDEVRILPTGEMNLTPVYLARDDLRRFVAQCGGALFTRYYGIWSIGAEAPAMAGTAWPPADAPLLDGAA